MSVGDYAHAGSTNISVIDADLYRIHDQFEEAKMTYRVPAASSAIGEPEALNDDGVPPSAHRTKSTQNSRGHDWPAATALPMLPRTCVNRTAAPGYMDGPAHTVICGPAGRMLHRAR